MSQTEQGRRVAEAQAAFKRHAALFRLQMSLVNQERVSVEQLSGACQHFQSVHLDEVAEERRLNNRCGYPLCNKVPVTLGRQTKVVDAKRTRILNAEFVGRFCDLACFDRLELLKVQLPVSKLQGSELDIPLVNDAESREKNGPKTIESTEGEKAAALPLGNHRPIVEKQNNGPIKFDFPLPGSTASTLNVEGYRQTLMTDAQNGKHASVPGGEKTTGALQSGSASPESVAIANQMAEQLRELGIDPSGLNASDVENAAFLTPSAEKVDNTVITTSSRDDDDDDDDQYDDKELECSEVDFDAVLSQEQEDEFAGIQDQISFLDLSDMKEALKAYQPSLLMRMLDTINQLKEPKVKEENNDPDLIDATSASRFQVLFSYLSGAVSVIALASSSPNKLLAKPTLLDALATICSKFNFSRPVPSFSVSEWQVFTACLLSAWLEKGKRLGRLPLESNDAQKTCDLALESLMRFVATKNMISAEEYTSLVNTIRRQI